MDIEYTKFMSLIASTLEQKGMVYIPCPSASAARALRKKFYRIRIKLNPYDLELADRVSLSVVGRHIIARAKPEWQQRFIAKPTGESHETTDQGQPATSPRLNDDGGVAQLPDEVLLELHSPAGQPKT